MRRRIVFILLCCAALLPLSLTFAQEESNDLRVTETLPTAGADDVAPHTVLTVIFNRPVIPLGVRSDAPDLPDPLTIEPAIEGTGEWLNTAIYTFTPDVAWGGGTTYTVTVDDIRAVDGSTLSEPYTFSFTVALPQVLTFIPEPGTAVQPLNTSVQMTFNQPIDRESLEANFFLRPESDTNGTVAGMFEWNEDSTGFMFTPNERLELDTLYRFGFEGGGVKAANSEATIGASNSTFRTVPLPAITGTDPSDGSVVRPYGGFVLFFASPMNPETLRDKITIEPAPVLEPDFFYRDWSSSYAVTFSAEPSTTYTITVAPGMEDVYGNAIEAPFTFSYTTGDYDPELNLQVPSGPVGFYDAGRDTTGLFITHRNVSNVNLDLYNVPLLDFISALGQNQYYNLSGIYAPRSQDLLRSWQIPSVAPPNVLRYELLELGNPQSGESRSGAGAAECPGAITSRAKLGDVAAVITEPDPLRARATPPDGEIVDLLYKGYVFTIVDGPICANNILWWGIQLRDGQTAWVAEGLEEEYFFEVTIPAASTPELQPQSTIELDGGALPPGVYMLSVNAPETQNLGYSDQRHFLVVGTANLVMKAGVDEVTIWATDVRTGEPLADVEISLYGISDVTIAQNTDEQGIARFETPRRTDLYIPLTAVLDDGENFGIGFSEWADGIDPWRFNINYNFYPQQYTTYLYTERPVYRPGQPVYFRGVVRQRDDITYTIPDFDTVPVKIFDSQGNTIFEDQLELTEFGTFSMVYDLAADASLGYYNISVELPVSGRLGYEGGSIGFDVAEYRLPEYQVTVTPEQPEVVQGDTIRAVVDASFFFGGPVVNANVNYTVSSSGYFFDYEGAGGYSFYDITRDDGGTGRLPFSYFYDPFYGETIVTGSGTTNGSGQFMIEVPAELLDATRSATWTVEANVRDSTGQTVSGRSLVIVHQGEVYVGVAPEEYVGTAGDSMTVNVITVDWDSQPVSGQEVEVEIVERRWSSVQTLDQTSGDIAYEYEVEEIPVDSGTVTTGADGKATFDFVPPLGGVYKAKVTTTDANGNTAVASTTMWVSSESYIAWRIDNNNRVDVIADRDRYEIGDTAEILITSPFQGEAEALITVERGGVLMTDRLTLTSNSATYELPITPDYAPNVYVSVFIVKGVDETNPVAAFRMGTVGLSVNNERKQLTINIEPGVERAGPGDTVTYTVTTTNYLDEPVSAEVGVALTDLASLSIGTPYAGPILDAFYGLQALGIRTSSPLTINTDYITQFVLDVIKGGGGGGGGGGIFEIREEFLDTAYWNATLVTDENGTATFEVTLPDNLTTWRLDARGVTDGADGEMLVGQETFDLISTKPVLVRPVTPRFFVVDDEVTLAAVVNNNSGSEQQVEVSIDAQGVTLHSDQTQTVTIPDGSSARVEWNVTVDDTESVELIFYASAGELTDATRPVIGQGDDRLLPVYRYEVPETVGTGGVLREADTREEQIVLPESLDVENADVTLNLDLSLAAAMTQSLDYLRNYPNQSIEATVSAFLPNVVTYRVLSEFGVQNDELSGDLNSAVSFAVQRLAAQQKPDGGWGWYVQDESNPLVTAWAVIGLVEAQQSGFTVDSQLVSRAVAYLQTQVTTRNAPGGARGQFLRDRQAFILYALSRAGSPDNAAMSNLYDQRDLLSIYAKALLAMALEDDQTRIDTLLDDIFADAITSANGVHWEEERRDPFSWNSNTRTNAIVLKALAMYRPESDLVPNVVRWLMVARKGDAWETTQETAWAVMGLSEWMRASDELNADYAYSATYNDETLVEDEATDGDLLNTQIFTREANATNTLTITRDDGAGNLYYTAYLTAFLPVPDIEPLNAGVIVQREYRMNDESVTEARVGDVIQVRLTIIAPNDLYYVVVEDPLPAGAEGIDPGLATSQQIGTQPGLEEIDPLSKGWGWWWFSNISFYDEKVVLNATYLPAGTYQYVYSIRAGVEGTYNVIPTTAREFYFPEVYGRGAGSTFTITPE